jgi:hypothetical protein
MSDNPFTRHPRDIGESYGEHMGRAASSGLRLIGSGLACLVHAVFPFLFERTASETIRDMHRGMVHKVDKPNWERHPII